MGKLLRFPTRPSQAVRISRLSECIWLVDVAAPSPDCSVARQFRSEREAVAYAQGFWPFLQASGTSHERQL